MVGDSFFCPMRICVLNLFIEQMKEFISLNKSLFTQLFFNYNRTEHAYNIYLCCNFMPYLLDHNEVIDLKS